LRTVKTMMCLLGMALALSVSQAHAAVVNGSFESQTSTTSNQPAGSTAITGWATTLDGVEYFMPSIIGGVAADGDWIVDLAYLTSSASGGIQQTITTTPGQASRLSFSLGTRASDGRSGNAQIVLMIDGLDVATYDLVNLTSSFVYEDLSHDFTPTNASTTIEFQSRQNALQHFAYLDHVGIQDVPEPGVSMLLCGGLLIWVARRPERDRS